ncbi:MAG: acyltransferase [Muribaculaceae bacterium]|nr:acyltransferase [Muribaculaceae bacterium]
MPGNLRRQSNLELLRIVAMLMVLVAHADFLALGAPDVYAVRHHPYSSLTRDMIYSFVFVSVNVYVMISGYFGIRTRWKSTLAFVFMVVFWRVIIFLGYDATGWPRPHNSMTVFRLMIPGYEDWFVEAYVLLRLIAPILNTYIENTSVRKMCVFVGCYYAFQIIFQLVIGEVYMVFNSGSSVLSFIGLYVIGGIFRKTRFHERMSAWKWLGGYALWSVFAGGILFSLMYLTARPWPEMMDMFQAHNGINVMIGSILLFLGFAAMRFRSRFVNTVAASTFAVYLFHMHPFVCPFYLDACRDLYANYPTLPYIGLMAALILGVFTFAVCVDRVRIWVWQLIMSGVDKILLHNSGLKII